MNSFEDAEIESKNISKLNSGGLINLRLHELWNKYHSCMTKKDYSLANTHLDRIWGELSGDTNDDDEEEFNKLNNLLPYTNYSKPIGFSEVNKDYLLAVTKQYIFLMRKEMFLRKLMNKQGKGTAYADDSENDWE